MGYLKISAVLVAFCAVSVQVGVGIRTHYRGAVVEYNMVWNNETDSKENMLENVKNYCDIMELGKDKGIDIIVFPEYGLVDVTATEFVRVPDVSDNVTPRVDDSQHQALQLLSAAAHDYQMYVVVNLKEISETDKGTFVYNTNVAFDRNGTIIGRYRKYNPFAENCTKPDAPVYSFFDTDFGVRFGMFTCFDILFDEPALTLVHKYGITDVAYPTAWLSQLPFLAAVQYQASWSYSTGVNLLASGLNLLDQGTSGTGIYGGFRGPMEYIQSEKRGCKVIYQNIPIKGSDGYKEEVDDKISEFNSKCSFRPEGNLVIHAENLDIYTTELISPSVASETASELIAEKTRIKMYSANETVCQGEFCCTFNVEFQMTFVPEVKDLEVKGDDFQYFRYRYAVLDGVRDFGGQATGGVQGCAIVPCLDENLDTCAVRPDLRTVSRLTVLDKELGKLQLKQTLFKRIWINGTFQRTRSLVSPNILMKSDKINAFGMLPDYKSFNFTKVDDGTRIHAELIFNNNHRGNISLVTAAIYSRLYDRDGQTPGVHNQRRSATFYTFISIGLALWVYKMFSNPEPASQ